MAKQQHIVDLKNVRDDIRAVFGDLQARYEAKGAVGMVKTSFDSLDLVLGGGIEPGSLVVVAGRPGAGKTSFCANMVAAYAPKEEVGLFCAFFQLRKTSKQMLRKIVALKSRVDESRMMCGHFHDTDWPRLQRSADALFKSNIHLFDRVGSEVTDLDSVKRTIDAFRSQELLGPVVIDSLQDFCAWVVDQDAKYAAHTEFCYEMKRLAIEMDIPIVVTSSVNSTWEKRRDTRPLLSDLTGVAGNAADIADVVLFVHRESQDCLHCLKNDGSCTADHERLLEIIVAKNSSGPVGCTVPLCFCPEHGAITEF